MNFANESQTDVSQPRISSLGESRSGLSHSHIAFATVVIISSAMLWRQIFDLIQYSLNNESASHILLIPAITAYLLFVERERIFGSLSKVSGSRLIVVAIAAAFCAGMMGRFFPTSAGDVPWLSTLFLMAVWIAGFYACYGYRAFRSALFPLFFLFLAVPLPAPVLDRIIRWLQEGSTTITYGIFHMFGVPVFRQGFFLTVPGVTIEVAQECSGIRSSVALLITCLLAGHMYLRTWWKMAIFVFLVVPWSILKNGIRIATLTLLSLYVNPGFLHGDLHRDGGVVFFLIALAGLFPVLLLLHKSEAKAHTELAPAQT